MAEPPSIPSCVICYTADAERKAPMPSCRHSICDLCCQQGLTIHGVRLNSQCPINYCHGTYDEADIRNFLSAPEFERYTSIQLDRVLSAMPDIRYCVRPGCGGVGFVPPACQAHPGQGFNTPMCATVVCRECDTAACVACRGEPHGFMSCAVYADWKQARYAPQALLTAALKAANAKSCKRCGTLTERIEGCNQVICTNCGFGYCWECLRSLEHGCGSFQCLATPPAPPVRAPAPPPAAPVPAAAAAPAAAVPVPAAVPAPPGPRRAVRPPPPRRRVYTEEDALEIPAWERVASSPARARPAREKGTLRDGEWAVVGKHGKTEAPPVRRDRRRAVAV